MSDESIIKEILIQFSEPLDECCGAYCEDAGCCVDDTPDIKNKEYG